MFIIYVLYYTHACIIHSIGDNHFPPKPIVPQQRIEENWGRNSFLFLLAVKTWAPTKSQGQLRLSNQKLTKGFRHIGISILGAENRCFEHFKPSGWPLMLNFCWLTPRWLVFIPKLKTSNVVQWTVRICSYLFLSVCIDLSICIHVNV